MKRQYNSQPREKVLETLKGRVASATLLKSKSILKDNGDVYEVRFSPEDRHFYKDQNSAHTGFKAIDNYKAAQQNKSQEVVNA